MNQDHQQYLHWTYFGDDAKDMAEFERIGTLLGDVDLFIDVGASHGVYTFQALQHMTGGSIIAVEADPERFAILEKNVAEWSAGSAIDVECIMAAASDHEDLAHSRTITFFTTGTQISGGLFPVGERSDEYRPIEISLVTLDDLVSGSDSRSILVKIDVEGGELRVLKGARSLAQSGRARFFVELSWWGDRERGTSVWTTLRYLWRVGLGIERRLRSDYLLFPEPDRRRRAMQVARVLPPLLPRFLFDTLVPYRAREAYIRRQNEQRLARARAAGMEL